MGSGGIPGGFVFLVILALVVGGAVTVWKVTDGAEAGPAVRAWTRAWPPR